MPQGTRRHGNCRMNLLAQPLGDGVAAIDGAHQRGRAWRTKWSPTPGGAEKLVNENDSLGELTRTALGT